MKILKVIQLIWVLLVLVVTWVFSSELFVNYNKLNGHLGEFLLLSILLIDFPIGFFVLPVSTLFHEIFSIGTGWTENEVWILESILFYILFIVLGWIQWFFIVKVISNNFFNKNNE